MLQTAAIENQFQQLFSEYGKNKNTIGIQAVYAEFLAFKKNEPENAIAVLKEALKLPINEFQKGNLKTKLADILVFTNKFSTCFNLLYTSSKRFKKSYNWTNSTF